LDKSHAVEQFVWCVQLCMSHALSVILSSTEPLRSDSGAI